MEKYLFSIMKIAIIVFAVSALVSFMAMVFSFKKKNWLKICLTIGIGTCIILVVVKPIWDNVYLFARDKGYINLQAKYKSLIASFSDRTSILAIRPVYFLPYYPDRPLAQGQRKASIVAEIKLKKGKLANNVHVKFTIEDGTDRRADSESWNVIAKQQSPIFSMLYPDVKFITWNPDIPNGIEAIAKDKQKPFKLWLTVTWEDADNKEHKIESYSELRYDEKTKLYYFDEIENKEIYKPKSAH